MKKQFLILSLVILLSLTFVSAFEVIISYNGTSSDVPTDWFYSNGSNGSPDVRDKMIMCAGGIYNYSDTGGSSTSSHTWGLSGTKDLISGSTFKTNFPSGTYLYSAYFSMSGTSEVTSHLAPFEARTFIYHPDFDEYIPPNGIVAFSGSLDDIPIGFSLCDGTNGVANLSGLFEMAVGSTYDNGDRGGTSTSFHYISASGTASLLGVPFIPAGSNYSASGSYTANGGLLVTAFSQPYFTLAYLQNTAGVPMKVKKGMIVYLNGNVSEIPTELNYGLCNGSSGTPDILDKFIRGVGGAYDMNDTGGNTEHRQTPSVSINFQLNAGSQVKDDSPFGSYSKYIGGDLTGPPSSYANHVSPFFASPPIMKLEDDECWTQLKDYIFIPKGCVYELNEEEVYQIWKKNIF